MLNLILGGFGVILALAAAGVYVLVNADDPLLRLLRPEVVMSVLHNFIFSFLWTRPLAQQAKKQPISSAWKTAA